MKSYFFEMGIFGFPLVFLAMVIAFLIVKKAVDLLARPGLAPPDREKGIGAILFWGAIGALLGVLGQLTGIYNALRAIVQADAISPKVCAIGLAESFTTTLFGLTLLLVAALAWAALHAGNRRRAAGASKGERR